MEDGSATIFDLQSSIFFSFVLLVCFVVSFFLDVIAAQAIERSFTGVIR
jgi:hypothetical protein